jgi:hypothetical protein
MKRVYRSIARWTERVAQDVSVFGIELATAKFADVRSGRKHGSIQLQECWGKKEFRDTIRIKYRRGSFLWAVTKGGRMTLVIK